MVKHKETIAGIFVIIVLISLVLSVNSLAQNGGSNPSTTLTAQEIETYREATKSFIILGRHSAIGVFQAFKEMPVKKSIAACEEKLVSNSRVLCYRLLSSARDDLQERKEICSHITHELCNDFQKSAMYDCKRTIQQEKKYCELGVAAIQ